MAADSLPDLYRRRQSVQRKHILRTLAGEAGYVSWERYRPRLEASPPADLEPLEVLARSPAVLKLWFANEAEAVVFVKLHGGRVVRIGNQAVVLPDRPMDLGSP